MTMTVTPERFEALERELESVRARVHAMEYALNVQAPLEPATEYFIAASLPVPSAVAVVVPVPLACQGSPGVAAEARVAVRANSSARIAISFVLDTGDGS